MLDTFSTVFAHFQKWGVFQQNLMFNCVPNFLPCFQHSSRVRSPTGGTRVAYR
jgi:hypothetical protein